MDKRFLTRLKSETQTPVTIYSRSQKRARSLTSMDTRYARHVQSPPVTCLIVNYFIVGAIFFVMPFQLRSIDRSIALLCFWSVWCALFFFDFFNFFFLLQLFFSSSILPTCRTDCSIQGIRRHQWMVKTLDTTAVCVCVYAIGSQFQLENLEQYLCLAIAIDTRIRPNHV